MTTKKARVGIIGVGRMGQPMVKHMIKHGYDVTAVDVSKDNLAKVAEMGAKIADTPAALGAVSDFIILGVGYDEEVNEVTLGGNGVLAALPRGAIIAVSSTVSPDTVKALDAAARARGCDVLDAPICRGRWFADEGKLLALAALLIADELHDLRLEAAALRTQASKPSKSDAAAAKRLAKLAARAEAIAGTLEGL